MILFGKNPTRTQEESKKSQNKSMKKHVRAMANFLTAGRIVPALVLVVVPALLVRGRYVPVLPETGDFFPAPFFGDTRSWWKAAVLCGCGAWMLVHAAARLAGGWRPRFGRFGVLAAVAAAVTILSALASDYPETSWLGFISLYEGAAALLAYLTAMWYVAEMADSEQARLLLARAAGVVGLVNGLHGVAEGFGWHFWRTAPGLWLMGARRDEVQYVFSDLRMAYGTAFQPNHYGMLMAMLGALALGMAFYESGRRWRIFWFSVLAATAGGLLFSQSRAGVFTFTALAAGFAVRRLRSGRIRYGLAVCLAALAIVGAATAGTESGRRAMARWAERSASLFNPTPATAQVRAVGLKDDKILVVLPDTTVFLEKPTPEKWLVQTGVAGEMKTEEKKTALSFQPEENGWAATAIPGVDGGRLAVREAGNAILTAPDTRVEFFSVGSRIFAVDAKNRRLYPELPSSPGRITGMEGFLGGRGFIWSRAMSAFARRPLLGSGPGAFALAFPNRNLLDKHRFSFDTDTDKAHAVWAALLVQLGLAGLVAYCLPAAYAFRSAARSGGRLGAPLFLAMAAYAVCSLANDSTVGVTPVFCALAGLAVAGGKETSETTDCPL